MSLSRKHRPIQSPLDALAEDVQAELARRVNSTEAYSSIRAWLAKMGVKTSIRGLSDWRKRRFTVAASVENSIGSDAKISAREIPDSGEIIITIHIRRGRAEG